MSPAKEAPYLEVAFAFHISVEYGSFLLVVTQTETDYSFISKQIAWPF